MGCRQRAKGANPALWQDTSLRHCQCFLVWIGLLFNPTHKQLQGKKRSDRETPIDSMALIAAGVSWSLLVLLSGLHLSRMLPAFW
jgi:hypothetical protein